MKIENVAVISLDDYAEYMELKKKANEKEDLPNNTWYKHSDYDDVLIFKTGKREGCGIDARCLWVDNASVWSFYDRPASWRNATREEVEQALVKEAKKRGLVEGVRIKSRWIVVKPNESPEPIKGEYVYYIDRNELCIDDNDTVYTLFNDGHWAEPVTEVDKFADIEKAYEEGAEIEFYSKVYGDWMPKCSNIWDGKVEYRIRPLKAGDWVYQDNKIYKIEHEVMKMSLQSDGWKRITDYELIDKLNTLAQNKD